MNTEMTVCTTIAMAILMIMIIIMEAASMWSGTATDSAKSMPTG